MGRERKGREGGNSGFRSCRAAPFGFLEHFEDFGRVFCFVGQWLYFVPGNPCFNGTSGFSRFDHEF